MFVLGGLLVLVLVRFSCRSRRSLGFKAQLCGDLLKVIDGLIQVAMIAVVAVTTRSTCSPPAA